MKINKYNIYCQGCKRHTHQVVGENDLCNHCQIDLETGRALRVRIHHIADKGYRGTKGHQCLARQACQSIRDIFEALKGEKVPNTVHGNTQYRNFNLLRQKYDRLIGAIDRLMLCHAGSLPEKIARNDLLEIVSGGKQND